LLDRLGLDVDAELADDAALNAAMKLDKKVRDARIRFVLPTRVGEVVLRDDVPFETVSAAWATIRRR
jgi:3-dehydroquinate synthase